MALFLAGLRSVDPDLVKAAQIDGAGPIRYYLRIVLPALRPITITVLVIQLQFAIKTFDLVRALTSGGPGIATKLPALVVYDLMFQRGQLGRGAAAAVLLLLSCSRCCCPMRLALCRSARRSAPMARAAHFILRPTRWLIYAALAASALFFLVPLVVVVLNSLRTNEEIAQGSMIGWPRPWPGTITSMPGAASASRRPATASGCTW